jgi:hypothetical protein
MRMKSFKSVIKDIEIGNTRMSLLACLLEAEQSPAVIDGPLSN